MAFGHSLACARIICIMLNCRPELFLIPRPPSVSGCAGSRFAAPFPPILPRSHPPRRGSLKIKKSGSWPLGGWGWLVA